MALRVVGLAGVSECNPAKVSHFKRGGPKTGSVGPARQGWRDAQASSRQLRGRLVSSLSLGD